jgi:hypothetical protein
MKNENEGAVCPRPAIAGETISVLLELGRITASEAFGTLEEVGTCGDSHDACSTATIVGEVLVLALEALWVDIDEAVAITSTLVECSAPAALQLLV